MRLLCFAALAIGTALWLDAATVARVKVEGGLVRTADNSLTVYKRIPFAAPPVGDLRWRVPAWPAFSGEKPGVMYFAWRRSPEGVDVNDPGNKISE
jgi:para-nitrobenzyl esterase